MVFAFLVVDIVLVSAVFATLVCGGSKEAGGVVSFNIIFATKCSEDDSGHEVFQ